MAINTPDLTDVAKATAEFLKQVEKLRPVVNKINTAFPGSLDELVKEMTDKENEAKRALSVLKG